MQSFVTTICICSWKSFLQIYLQIYNLYVYEKPYKYKYKSSYVPVQIYDLYGLS